MHGHDRGRAQQSAELHRVTHVHAGGGDDAYALDEFSNAWDALRGALDAEERKLLVRLIDAHSALLEVSREEFFVRGFRLGGQLVLELAP